jgi:tetratricopeptide (TPR) repeat protein
VVPEAYELYLEGRFLCDNWSPQEMRLGIERLERVLQIDPDNVPALAHLALCLQYSAFFGYQSPLEVHDQSMRAAKRAVQLDGNNAEAYVALAGIQYYLEFNPKAAMTSLEKALELDPSSVRALMHASWLYGESGKFGKAFELNQRAVKLDPMSAIVTHAMGQLYFLSRDYENAILQTRKALKLDPNDPSIHYFLALPFEQQQQFEESRDALHKAIELSDGAPLYRAALAHTFGKAGLRESATQILDELLLQESTPPFAIALVHLGLGDDEQALDWLEKSFDAKDSQVIYINRDPRFDTLRTEPRFIRILEKIDFPPGDTPLESG